jgi:GNAT superfamily N-acetyltransferase
MTTGSQELVAIEKAQTHDAPAILALQKIAYRGEAELYPDYPIQPLLQTLAELELEFEHKLILKAATTGALVGSVRGWQKEGTVRLERLFVHPSQQGRGIGTLLISEFENSFRNARRFELFTGHRSTRNLSLYVRLGYRPFKYELARSGLELVHLEKNAPREHL